MKKSFLPAILIFLSLLGWQLPLSAQISIMRNYFPAPLEDTTYTKGFFGKLAFSAEGSRGFGSALDEQAWNVKYIGFVELYRFSERSAIGGSLSHEFTANPHNEINFHMRGAIWNETLAWFYKFPSTTMEMGVTHHCRHEIDNTVPADELADNRNYVPTRRLIVLTGPYLSLQSNWWQHKRFSGRLYSRLNLYTYRVDGRKPGSNFDQSLDFVRASAILGGRVNYRLSPQSNIYGRSWFNPVYFTEDAPFKHNFRLETGLSIGGRVGSFELFGAYEYFFDDMSRPYPLPSQVLSVGIRGRSKDLF
jgi:hypothetical protein